MKRREALNRLMIGTGTTVLLPASILSSCSEDPAEDDTDGTNGNDKLEINLDDAVNSDLNSDGGYRIVSGIIVINTGNENFVALSSACTHEGCAVEYDNSANNLPCDCHGAVFSTSGSVLNGPATVPLKKYQVSRTGNILKIS